MNTAIETYKNWLASKNEEIASRQIGVEVQFERASEAIYWLYCPSHLIDIAILNHAFCVDVVVYDAKSEELVYSEAGSCGSALAVLERLNRLWSWYIAQQA